MSSLASCFVKFHGRYVENSRTRTQSVAEQARKYLSGLMLANKKNVERMAEVVPIADYQSQNHFISQSPWEHLPVMNQVAKDCDRLFCGVADTALIIDECAMEKKGEESVEIARQWSGRLGKVDNCRVGVFAVLCRREDVTLIDERLHLPSEWACDKECRKDAEIPEDARFATKSELALEMVLRQRANGIRFAWVGVDGGYGKDTPLLCALDDEQEVFVADVHKDQMIYLQDAAPHVPKRVAGRGQKPVRAVSAVSGVRVDQWAAAQPEESWRRLKIRDSTKGTLRADFLYRRVWI